MLHYRVDGAEDAPALVLLNSIGADLDMWRPQMPAFSEHFRVIRIDARGHGKSEVPPSPYSVEDCANDVLGLLEAVSVSRAHLCGISFGGMIAMWIAAHHPRLVERMVLVSTAARIGSKELWEERAETARADGMKALEPIVMSRFFTDVSLSADTAAVRSARATFLATSPIGYAATCLALRDADLTDVLSSISAPSLVIGAELDAPTPPSNAHELHSRIAGSRLKILGGAAHLCNLERPQEFNQVVTDFLLASTDDP
jgi:3-oxoadipate enol-lactonase